MVNQSSSAVTWPRGDRALVDDLGSLDGYIDAGYGSVWSLEGSATDAFTPLGVAAIRHPGISIGTAIASVFSRGPALLAMEAATVAGCVSDGGEFFLGLGTSTPQLAAGWNDRIYERPAQRMADTLEFLRAAFDGERIDRTWDTFTIDRFTLNHRPEQQPTILVAALGERMVDVANRHADGLILNWTTADDVTRLRNEADNLDIVAARLFVITSTDLGAVRDMARSMILPYLCAGGYQNFHRRMGRTELEPVWELWAGRRFADAAAAVHDDVLDALVISGTPADCQQRIDDHVQAGVTHPILAPLTTAGHPASHTLSELAPGDLNAV